MNAGPRLRVAVTSRAVHPLHGLGGLERHVFDLVRHLAARGVEVTLVTPPPRPGCPREAIAALETSARLVHVPYVTFPLANRPGTTILDRDTAYPLFGWRAGRRAAHLVAQGRIDVVHGLGASALGYARARRRGAGAPLVLNPQGLEEFGATAPDAARLKRLAYVPLQRAVRAVARAADCVLATDRALVPVVERWLPMAAGKVAVVPNAIDVEACRRHAGSAEAMAMRQQAGLGASDFVMLSVGRLERNKGFDVMVDALAGARARLDVLVPGWTWVLAGDGPERRALASRVQSAGLAHAVRLAGRLSDAALHAWYEAATVFVHPTRYEGSSLVTLEAMAHARPVVATRAGGLPDKVVDDVTGWLVAPSDAGALARALVVAAEALARLPAMGAEGAALVDREFAWPAVARRTEEVYRRLLAYDSPLGTRPGGP